MKNRIYFFTGTGNSLHIAKKIASELKDCEIMAIKKDMDMEVLDGYDRIGFVFPTYGWASPLMVANFYFNAKFPKQKDTYFFAVTNCGGLAFNAIPQTKALLAEKGIELNYGAKIVMYKNSITNYRMGQPADKMAAKSDKDAIPVINDIVNKRNLKIGAVNKFLFKLHLGYMKNVHATAKSFNVSKDCISCGICQSVCPAKNITLENGKPIFDNQCERCGACIQLCPKQAINYLDKTQSRGRYKHPQVSAKEIADYYKI